MHFQRLLANMIILLKKYGSINRFIMLTVVTTVFYSEYLCYTFATFSWQSLYSDSSESENQLKIMLVADPQIVGYNDVAHLGFVSRSDCDRYLRKTFSRAFNHIDPDVVLFMGDLFDEGSTATDEEFAIYVDRFFSIFNIPDTVRTIYIPGDNDVGGEGFDRKEDWKVKRFDAVFKPDSAKQRVSVQSVKFVNFWQMNLDATERLKPEYIHELREQKADAKYGNLNIVLNHMEIIARYDVNEVIEAAQPDFIFSAHWHKAKWYSCLDCREKLPRGSLQKHRWQGNALTIADNTVFNLELKNNVMLSEMAIPTCSYRMGVPQMGYGYALLNESGKMKYTVLWLPSRYKYLYFYIFVLVLMSVVVLGRYLVDKLFPGKHILPLYNRSK